MPKREEFLSSGDWLPAEYSHRMGHRLSLDVRRRQALKKQRRALPGLWIIRVYVLRPGGACAMDSASRHSILLLLGGFSGESDCHHAV